MNNLIKQITKLSLITAWFLFLTACANVIPPTGGKRDLTPPQLIDSLNYPNKVHNTNRSGGNILLVFNEKTDVVGLKSQITSNPAIDNKLIKYKTRSIRWADTSSKKRKGTAISINLNQPLDDNTTYVINFGRAFKDINEGKIANNISIAFSTGSKIDSLSINGKVKYNTTGKLAKDIFIGIYTINDTSHAINTLPKYYANTNEDGNFKINYLKNDSYRLVAFTDKNRNKKYDSKTELIAFVSDNILLDSNYSAGELLLFKEDKRLPIVNRVTTYDKISILEFNKPIEKVEINNYDNNYLKFDTKRKKLSIYKKLVKNTSISIKMTDSIGISTDSVISLRFENDKLFKQKTNLSVDNQYINSNFKQIISFSQPIFETYLDSASIYTTDTTYNFDTIVKFKWNLNKTELSLSGHIKKYHDTLHLDNLTFISILGDTLSKSTKIIRTPSNKFGSVVFEIKSKQDYYVIDLLDKNNKILATGRNVKTLALENYKPQEITIRILLDENNNGKYDTGDYLNNKLPERYIYQKETVKIKAGWDVDVPIYIDNRASLMDNKE